MKSSSTTDTSGQQLLALVAILTILGVTAGAWLMMQQSYNAKTEIPGNLAYKEPSPVPTATPKPRPIPHGKTSFTISTSQNGPQMSTGFLDPYDPSRGTTQTIALTLTDTSPIQKVTAIIQTDTKKRGPIEFTRVSGTDISGEWQGTWTVDDTYNYVYIVDFVAQSATGTTKVQSTFR